MRYFILLILLGFPLAEGALLYRLGQGHGGWVIAWLIFAAFAGVVLIKQARFELIARLAYAVRDGQFSLAALIDSFRTVLAGLLLIFPGIISDVMALCLLLLPIRGGNLEPAWQPASRNNRNDKPRSGSVIDAEFHREH